MSTLTWTPTGPGRGVLHYSGGLLHHPEGRALRVRVGVDGWRDECDVALEPADGRGAAAAIDWLDGAVALDCAVTDGIRWDNNHEADYRLWLGLRPVDAHVHIRDRGDERLGEGALVTALRSAGIEQGIVSWADERFINGVVARHPGARALVWIRPGRSTPRHVAKHLREGRVGLKLHPNVDRYAADDPRLDPFLRLAAEHRVPVAVHSAPFEGDPDKIRRAAERHPDVQFLLYHTFLGPPEGRERAIRHAREVPNLHLETSWCSSSTVMAMVDAVGPERVVFGSDAAVDGPRHFRNRTLELHETYNECLVALRRGLTGDAARLVLADNARRLFRLPGPDPEEAAGVPA